MKTYKTEQLSYLYDDIDYLLCYAYVFGPKVALFGFTPLTWN